MPDLLSSYLSIDSANLNLFYRHFKFLSKSGFHYLKILAKSSSRLSPLLNMHWILFPEIFSIFTILGILIFCLMAWGLKYWKYLKGIFYCFCMKVWRWMVTRVNVNLYIIYIFYCRDNVLSNLTTIIQYYFVNSKLVQFLQWLSGRKVVCAHPCRSA